MARRGGLGSGKIGLIKKIFSAPPKDLIYPLFKSNFFVVPRGNLLADKVDGNQLESGLISAGVCGYPEGLLRDFFSSSGPRRVASRRSIKINTKQR